MGPCRLTSYTIYFRLLGVLAVMPLVVSGSCDGVTVGNGAVYTTSDQQLSDSLFVQCHSGFHLLPPEGSFSCSEGQVSPTPQCVQISNCSHTCDIADGYCIPSKPSFSPGETVEYRCNQGYVLEDTTTTQTCGLDGSWSPANSPTCRHAGKMCTISKSEALNYFLDPELATTFQHLSTSQVRCQKGYYDQSTPRNNKGNITCINGEFDKPLDDLCIFVGVKVHITYSMLEDESRNITEALALEKGMNVSLTCKVRSDTQDGLPFPEISWLYPSRLRDLVDFKEGDAFVHEEYIQSINEDYSLIVEEDMHYIQGVLTISPAMEVHSGEYTCSVKLVNYSNTSSTAVIKVDKDLHIGLYFLLIIPVVLFVIVHCFYRKATLSPFPAPNKLTKDMMQEVDKKKKLEELQANPAYQQIQVMGGEKNQRGRRGAVVDI